MHLQSVVALCVAALAGTSFAAQYNDGNIPSHMRQARNRFRAYMSDSDSSSMAMPTPSSSAVAMRSEQASSSAMMAMMSSTATPSFARPSPTTFALHKFRDPPSSSAYNPSASATRHHSQESSTAQSAKVNLPLDIDGNDNDHPYWTKSSTKKPVPGAPLFDSGNAPVIDKDSCSVRCQDLAKQCVDLLPNNNDYCWNQYPSCQDLCVKEHVDS